MATKHKIGTMDISEQERTFEGFVRWTIRAVVATLAVLILLAILA